MCRQSKCSNSSVFGSFEGDHLARVRLALVQDGHELRFFVLGACQGPRVASSKAVGLPVQVGVLSEVEEVPDLDHE